MSRRKRNPEEIKDRERYFNRMVAVETQREKIATANYHKMFRSLDGMIEGGDEGTSHDSLMFMAVNENGEEYDEYISSKSFLGWIEVIENQTLYEAVKSLSVEDQTLLTYRYKLCLSQVQIATLMQVPQTSLSYRERQIKKYIHDFFKKVAKKS